ncbi:toll-like receptor 4 [Crassostrea angulata]|uniref:toll-like receptor 4 n=1 Tax=Magallana angulata TaxID=2784310 RepID=UPI0022B095ED|nr:toll-like receptor 4 [Crassostrea angulata]
MPRLEVNKSLKLIVRDRDYLPGIPKVDSIMNGLQESKRTICIVSKKYLESKWRDYELNMAKVEAIEDRGSLDYVILILLPEVYNDEIPHKIMDLIKKDRFIEYPMESCAYDDFWERLMGMLDQ